MAGRFFTAVPPILEWTSLKSPNCALFMACELSYVHCVWKGKWSPRWKRWSSLGWVLQGMFTPSPHQDVRGTNPFPKMLSVHSLSQAVREQMLLLSPGTKWLIWSRKSGKEGTGQVNRGGFQWKGWPREADSAGPGVRPALDMQCVEQFFDILRALGSCWRPDLLLLSLLCILKFFSWACMFLQLESFSLNRYNLSILE